MSGILPVVAEDDSSSTDVAPFRLLPIEPIGVGGPDVESLTSYLIRLGNEHWNSPKHLYTHMIRHHVGTRVRAKHDCRLDGYSVTAERCAAALKEFSPLGFDFRRLTCLSWRGAFPARSATAFIKSKRWCTSCYADMRNASVPLHNKLIWSLQPASICLRHMILLSERCPTCNSKQGLLTADSVIGSCQHCGRSLLDPMKNSHSKAAPQEEALWNTRACHDLIGYTQNGNVLTIENLRKTVSRLVKNEFAGSARRVARELNLPSDALRGMLRRGSRPRLSSLLDFAFRMGILPTSFFSANGELNINSRTVRPIRPYKRAPYISARELEDIRRRLLKIIDQNEELLSTEAVAEKLGVSRILLMKRLPDECAQVVARVKVRRSREKRERDEARADRVRERALALMRKGIYPSDRKVRAKEGILPSDLRMPQIKAVLRKLQASYLSKSTDLDPLLVRRTRQKHRKTPTRGEIELATRTYDPEKRQT